MNNITELECDVKMFLFARWMAVCYDSNTLNTESGEWWKERLQDFNENVYPNYIENGTVEDTEEYLNKFTKKLDI